MLPILIGLIAVIIVVGIFFFIVTHSRGVSLSGKTSKKDRETIIRNAVKRLSQNPNDSEALYALGTAYFEEENWEKAMRNFEILAEQINSGSLQNIDRFEVFLKYGISAKKLNMIEQAYKGLVAAKSYRQDNFDVNYELGTIEFERNTDTRLGFGYGYSPFIKPFEPFKNMKSTSGALKFLKDFSLTYLPNSLTFNSEISRNYYETQLRDLNDLGGENMMEIFFREDFYWNRNAALQWSITKNLSLSMQTGTQARIDAHDPSDPNFSTLAYEDYMENWRDSVWHSITKLGTPLNYAQTFNASYNVPFKSIPVLDFMTANVAYNATYNWDKGAEIGGGRPVENIIRNERRFAIDNVNLNLLNLYNKSEFLKKANQKFTMQRPNATNAQRRNAKTEKPQAPEKKENKKYEGEVKLNADSTTTVSHKLNNKRIRVTARGENGRLYNLKFKIIDANSIKIANKDTVNLKLVIAQLPHHHCPK